MRLDHEHGAIKLAKTYNAVWTVHETSVMRSGVRLLSMDLVDAKDPACGPAKEVSASFVPEDLFMIRPTASRVSSSDSVF